MDGSYVHPHASRCSLASCASLVNFIDLCVSVPLWLPLGGYSPRLGRRASCSPLKIQHFTPMAPKFVRASCKP